METNQIVGPSKADVRRYAVLNKTIETGLGTFLEVGGALAEIKEQHLYRVEYESWDDYLEKKHGLKRQYASRLIKAKEVVSALKEMLPIGNISKLPRYESQVRPLLRLKSPEERSTAWLEAIEAAGGNQPTAEEVAEKVKAMQPAIVKAERESQPATVTRHPAVRKTQPAILHDGTQVPDSLWEEGYVDAKTAQRKLDDIGKQTELKPEEKSSLQEFFIDLVAALNVLHEEHPTVEMRKEITSLFKKTLTNLLLVVAKPGDYEVSLVSSE